MTRKIFCRKNFINILDRISFLLSEVFVAGFQICERLKIIIYERQKILFV